ncbi:hypothetical protein F5884DRAFT_802867 [Xylogone sp. PMI_703]|nr:hypothetical protein F5884DRAFT_802867 [Xylogone sp. PMI_703]
MANGHHHGPKIIQWLVDTRPLWPVPPKGKPQEEVAELKNVASRALSVLTPSERDGVLRYYHLKDAKMSLVSQLIKHYFITKYCGVPWSQSKISRDANGKPCYIPEGTLSGQQPSVDFNVSHQAGLVTLVAAIGFQGRVDVGTDIVCVDERLTKDYEFIEKKNFFDWVDMYADVFSDSEVNEMKLAPVNVPLSDSRFELRGYGMEVVSCCGSRNRKLQLAVLDVETGTGDEITVESNIVIDAKLRRFYAYWCLRETYVKMTGEALLAPWLKDLMFKGVVPPAPRKAGEAEGDLIEGEILKEFHIEFQGKKVTDVTVELAALGSNYMVGAAVRAELDEDRRDIVLGPWENIDLESILWLAEN